MTNLTPNRPIGPWTRQKPIKRHFQRSVSSFYVLCDWTDWLILFRIFFNSVLYTSFIWIYVDLDLWICGIKEMFVGRNSVWKKMNSSEPVTVNQSLKVLEQLESFENSDLVIVMCYLIMSISKYLSLNIKGRVRLCVSQVISSFLI